MRLFTLRASNLRCHAQVEMAPAAGLNLLLGPNGAGKTSLLEAAHVLAHGRSFRGRVRDGLIRQGAEAVEIHATWHDPQDPRERRVGLRHRGTDWEARLDGVAPPHLGALCAELAVVTLEPGSHALVVGGADERRRYLDWGLFHVEPGFLESWRQHARAHRQRNQLLKTAARDAELVPWEAALAKHGETITRQRERYLDALQPHLRRTLDELGGDAIPERLGLRPGWKREQMPLADALLLARERDRRAGHGTVGAHRADLGLEIPGLPGREALSRGQAKLLALGLLLAQARLHAELRGGWPLLALDDPASELDAAHQAALLSWLAATPAQCLVTGVAAPSAPMVWGAVFHVEPNRVRRVG
jgi:DNA replication and repair protein RecF